MVPRKVVCAFPVGFVWALCVCVLRQSITGYPWLVWNLYKADLEFKEIDIAFASLALGSNYVQCVCVFQKIGRFEICIWELAEAVKLNYDPTIMKVSVPTCLRPVRYRISQAPMGDF